MSIIDEGSSVISQGLFYRYEEKFRSSLVLSWLGVREMERERENTVNKGPPGLMVPWGWAVEKATRVSEFDVRTRVDARQSRSMRRAVTWSGPRCHSKEKEGKLSNRLPGYVQLWLIGPQGPHRKVWAVLVGNLSNGHSEREPSKSGTSTIPHRNSVLSQLNGRVSVNYLRIPALDGVGVGGPFTVLPFAHPQLHTCPCV